MSKKVSLTQGQFAIVDDDDFFRVCEYAWRARKTYSKNKFTGKYEAIRRIEHKGKDIYITMGQFIMFPSIFDNPDMIKDERGITISVLHSDGDLLDNRECNLKVKKKQSIYRGVNRHSKNGAWVVCIRKRNRVYFYKTNIDWTEKEAAEVYNQEAERIFGDKAILNKF
jgi:hypothetical protein